jgi:porin
VTIKEMRARSVAVSSALALGVLVGSAVNAHAQQPPPADDGSARSGASLKVVYTGVVFSNMDGGIRRGETYVGNLNVELNLDGDELFGMPGVTAYLDGLWVHGGQPSELVGDAQGVNNIAAPTNITLYEAWLQFNVLDNRFSALVGRFDTNAEFYRLQSAGLFLNSSFGIGPEFALSGTRGPSSFPWTSVGVRLTYKPARAVVLRTAILDGVPVDRPDSRVAVFQRGDGLLLVSEAAVLNRPATGEQRRRMRLRIGRASGLPPYDHKIAAGMWYYTADFEDLNKVGADGTPTRHRGSGGVYVLGDARLWRSSNVQSRRLTGFVEVGFGDGRVNRFGSYVGAGLVATAPLSRRPSDEFGAAIAIARNGAGYLDQQRRIGIARTRAETAIEVTYLAQIASWLAVQPDLQYVINPNTDSTVRNGLGFQLRFETTF